MRLDKFICDSSNNTRSEVKKLAKNGQIRVNGEIATDTSAKIDETEDVVTVSGRRLLYKKYVYLMMNKPAGVLTATEDRKGKKTFADLIGEDYSFYEVTAAGRLDIDAEGFLLLTNDGAFVHNIITPEKHVEKEYYCEISGELDKNAPEKFENGVKLNDGYICMPAKLDIRSVEAGVTKAVVTVCEGRFHQVKRMVAACGGCVDYLKRISIGGVRLDESLASGEYRELTQEELEILTGKSAKKQPDDREEMKK